MSQFGDLYAGYYDLLYNDKDYKAEAKFVDSLIKKYNATANTMLDVGCGTGKHAEIFADMGYAVHGIDLSEDMLAIARKQSKSDNVTFSKADVTAMKLDEKYDTIVSLFHVMSYQTTNEALIKAFEGVYNHLKDGGVFVFDFWYGPAVLSDKPATKIKRLENDDIKVTRLSEPVMYPERNVVDVNFDVFIEDKSSHEVTRKKELHTMRYLFDTELSMICDKIGFDVVETKVWMDDKQPNFESWNVVWIVKK